MSWSNYVRHHRWSAAWIIVAILSAYLAFTGISSLIGGQLLPVAEQGDPTPTAETPIPQPEQMFTSALVPPSTQEEKASTSGLTIGREIGKYLAQALELARDKQFRKARDMVNAAMAVPNKTPYEEFKIREILAYVALNLGDYAIAAKVYEDALSSSFLTADQHIEYLKVLAQLHYKQKNYDAVKKFGQLFLDKNGYNAEILLLMAQAEYVQKDYEGAAKSASTLIDQSKGEIKEDWLKLLMSSQHHLGQRNEVMKTLTKLLELYPAPAYWKDMFSYLNTTPNMTDRLTLETYRLKLNTIGLQASDYSDMAELAMALGLPGEAESVLQQAFDARLFGDENTSAREARLLALAQTNSMDDREALAALDKKSRNTFTGKESAILGEAYLSYGKYEQAVDAINRGLDKGNFAQVGEAQLHLGIALVKLNQTERARAAFNAVPKNSALHKVAKLWAARLAKPQL